MLTRVRILIALVFLAVCSSANSQRHEVRRYVYKPHPSTSAFTVVESASDDGGVHVKLFAPNGEDVLLDLAVSPDASVSHPVFEFVDLNGDGYLDVLSLVWAGATGNSGYVAYLFVPHEGRLVLASIAEQKQRDREFLNPSWEQASRSVHERLQGGHAGMLFGEYCSRWSGSRLVPYLSVSSDDLPRKSSEDEVRYKLIFEVLRKGGVTKKQMVISGERLGQRFFGKESRGKRCEMWARAFRAF